MLSAMFLIVMLGLSVPILAYEQECLESYNVDNCGPGFQQKCSCGCANYLGKQQFIVNCTNIGFNNTLVLEHLPLQTEVLIFIGNTIEDLPWNVFGTLNNYTKLQVVDMSNNGLREIRGKSYHRVSNVRRLILNHNRLSVAEGLGDLNHHHPRIFSNFVNLKELHLTNAFEDNTPENLAEDLHDIFVKSNLTQLEKLHLEQNEIKSFKDSQIFCDLPGLKDLHLGDNLLIKLDFNIKCLPHLRFLDMERNRITALDFTDLQVLDALPARNQSLIVDLSGNPFACDCAIKELYGWLQSTNVTVRNKESLRCQRGLPDSNGGEAVMGLRRVECMPELVTAGTHSRSIPVLLAFLAALLCVLIGTLLYMNRRHLQRKLSPILDTVSRKVQYTSIGKHEEQEMDV